MLRRVVTGDVVEVTFELSVAEHPGGVTVCGDFNGWDEQGTPLVDRGDGTRSASVTVAVHGRYPFRYRSVDGNWFNEGMADDFEPNEFGGINGVLVT